MAASVPSDFLNQFPRGCWGSTFRAADPDTAGQGTSHPCVPKKLDLEVRSAPDEYGSGLMQELDEEEFPRLPMRRAVGRAFVNLECSADAEKRVDTASLDSDAGSTLDASPQDAYASSRDSDACWQDAFVLSHDASASWQDADAHSSPEQSARLCMVLLPCVQEAWIGCSSPTRATSLTLLNVPAHYTDWMLSCTLYSLGLLSSCNLLHLPRAQAVGDALTLNVGHALLNFRTPDDADLARSRLTGHAWDIPMVPRGATAPRSRTLRLRATRPAQTTSNSSPVGRPAAAACWTGWTSPPSIRGRQHGGTTDAFAFVPQRVVLAPGPVWLDTI
ncbi:unnamed protein product [Prorocentrum cordatum]|uniref:RRM domain-containing protein n=1 Tax=Prorocentrum cordatum TaxID=2364126 RepID=A0ABN9SGT7_9DINO|nr:unnamed protein product [Polarella glacialis]